MSIEEKKFKAAVITMSDRAYCGEYGDISGIELRGMLENEFEIVAHMVLPDDCEALKRELIRLCDNELCDLIITTGGTGFAPRDITPEATLAVAERNVPGIAEAIRAESMRSTKRAMLSRGVSVIRKNTLIINLPGSPKAVRESLDAVLDTVPHGLRLLRGEKADG